MRVLGIDIGLKRTGLALSDESGLAIRFLPNLLAKNRAHAIEQILSLVHEFAIATIVIGLPEKKSLASKAIASRAEGLKKALDLIFTDLSRTVQVYLWDEALTSKKALKQLNEAGLSEKKRRAKLDAASAALLVEDFLFWQKIRPSHEK
jgi:putative Holliday junction resolvase